MTGNWFDNISQTVVYDCNRLTGAFLNVYKRTALPLADWPNKSDFLERKTSSAYPQVGDFVAMRNRSPVNTLSPRFSGKFLVKKRLGNSIVIEDDRQINLHDCVLVGRNKENIQTNANYTTF